MSAEFWESYRTNTSVPLDLFTQVRMASFIGELDTQAAAPPAHDVRIAAACQAMRELCERPHSPFRQMIEDCLQERMEHRIGQLSPNEANDPTIVGAHLHETGSFDVNRALRAAQRGLLLQRERGEIHYPEPFYESGLWKDVFRRIAHEPESENGKIFREDFTYHGGHANVTDRYKAVTLVAKVFPDRFQEQPALTLLDGGSSENLGGTRLVAQTLLHHEHERSDHYGFGDVIAKEPDITMSDLTFQINPELTDAINHKMHEGHSVARVIGIDKEDISTPEYRLRCKADSFYPSEFLAPAAGETSSEEIYDLLYVLSRTLDSVSFFRGDLAHFDKRAFDKSFPKFRADISILSTMLYQLPSHWQKNVIETMLQHTKKSGILLISDFARRDPQDPTRAIFEQHWFNKPFPYRNFVIFPEDPSRTLYEIFRWSNGRCRELVLGKDAARLGVRAALGLND